uniref:Transthyretin-like family protein n=1 Tax=Panagrellus redivivus TaxID=6233 RepID=A0A7E4VI47_PANRE
MSLKSLIILTIALIGLTEAFRYQSTAIKGKLLCGVNPAKNVRIKLWDEDSGPDPDDLLDSGYTDANGEFLLKGGTTELTNIDAIFKVYHDCDDGIKPGSRKVKFQIPNSYVFDAQEPKKVFDIGILNLETIFAKEERELIVSKRRRHLDLERFNSEDAESYFF